MNREQRRRKGGEPKLTTCIGYLHPGETSAAFTYSLVETMLHETFRTGMPPALIAERCSSGQIVAGRNRVTSYFLQTPAEWLLFADADMGFAGDALARLLAVADPQERPIVGALCFATRRQVPDPETRAERFASCPTVYVWVERDDEVGFAVVKDYPRDQVVAVSATGAAFVLIHRSVFERIAEKYGETWWDEITHPTGPTRFSEDMSFYIRAAACGIPVHVDTSVKTSHDKGGVFLTEETWDAQQALVGLAA